MKPPQRAWLTWGLGLLALGAAFVIQGVVQERNARHAGAAVEARGSVVEKWIVRADRDSHRRSEYWIRYQFSTSQGTAEIDAERWEGTQPGSPVDVTYAAGDPRRSQIDGELEVERGGGSIGVGLAFLCAGVFCVRRHGFQNWSGAAASALRKTIRLVVRIATALAVVFVAAVLSNLPPFPAAARYTEDHEGALLTITGAAALAGLAVFIGSLLLKAMRTGSANDEFTIADLRLAWKQGRLSQQKWRGRISTLLGASLLVLGIFSSAFVAGPPFLKVIVLFALLFVGWKVGALTITSRRQ